jgi:hypothetical protein
MDSTSDGIDKVDLIRSENQSVFESSVNKLEATKYKTMAEGRLHITGYPTSTPNLKINLRKGPIFWCGSERLEISIDSKISDVDMAGRIFSGSGTARFWNQRIPPSVNEGIGWEAIDLIAPKVAMKNGAWTKDVPIVRNGLIPLLRKYLASSSALADWIFLGAFFSTKACISACKAFTCGLYLIVLIAERIWNTVVGNSKVLKITV